MIKAVVRRTMLANRYRKLNLKIDRYSETSSRDPIEAFQLRRFNEVWAYCLAEVPFYGSWQREHHLPARIDDLGELQNFPPLTKDVLVSRSAEIFDNGKITDAYTSGGSTGQPTRYPRGQGELDENWSNSYLGRHWSGVGPTDRNVHLWGHAHLFGRGLAGNVAHARRKLADKVLGVTRLNAYDLSDRALAHDYEVLHSANPLYLSGYTSAIFKLARYIEQNERTLEGLTRLKVVVLCSETVSDADVALVQRVFGVPVAIEYGAAETGVIAMSQGETNNIRLLWDSHIAQVMPTGELQLTTLSPRLFPLVNYAIRDRVQPSDIRGTNALAFAAVLGRTQDIVRMADSQGVLDLSAILPVHILKSYQGITGVQFRQARPGLLEIHVEANQPVDLDAVHAYFVGELRRDHPTIEAGSVRFVRTIESSRTVAGKHALFLDR